MKQILFDFLDGLRANLLYDPVSPMIFSTSLFLFLFLGVALVYTALDKKVTARLLFITLFSYYFYYKSSGFYFFLLAVVTVSDFLLALAVDWSFNRSTRYAETGRKPWSARFFMFLSLLIDLGLLAYFKYAHFFSDIWASLSGKNWITWDIFLPVGISFFTFQSMSYTIDVYRRELKPLHNLLDYAFYVSFFPQLVAGPIVRARDFIPQIRKPLAVDSVMFGQGVFLIFAGLFKKAIISDYISVNFVERIFDNPSLYSGVENLFGVYGYALQIYCDFSGYSDMAIGLALLLGFHFPQNFNSPYKAWSVTEFWHRWHISLSTWLRDYLYISMGGNRKGKIRTYFNLFMTMLLGGLWHGASWNFVMWGGLHGVALALHKGFRSLLGRKKGEESHGWKKAMAVFLTFHFVCFCWIFFRNQSFENSWVMIGRIFTAFHPEVFVQMIQGYKGVFILMLLGYLLHFCPDRWQQWAERGMIRLPLIGQALLLVALIYCVIQIKSSDIQPFIYFQF